MKIHSSSSTRIDLAGGTLDIYPLYIFENGGLTINIAISLRSRVEVASRNDNKIVISSKDLNKKMTFKSINDLKTNGPLSLISRIIKFYWNKRSGLDIRTENTVPKGSGLGASSSLLISLSSAISSLSGEKYQPEKLIDWGANIEAQELGIPTGKQDYYPAVYGGINILHFNEKGISREDFKLDDKFKTELEKHLILTYTGISHFSGTNNWAMMKKYIDKDKQTVRSLKKIKETAFRMRQSIINHDLKGMAESLNEEWENRKKLAKGVTNSKIDKLIKDAADNGAFASKICGAGGGGCLVTIAPPEKRDCVIKSLIKNNAEILYFYIDPHGNEIKKI